MNTDTSTNNGLTRTLSDITSPLISDASSSNTGSIGSENWFYFSWKTWIIIILLLAFLGINIFAYLGKGINEMTAFLKPILALIGYKAVSTTEQTADVALEGAKAGAKVGAGIALTGAETGLDLTASGIDLAAKGATTGINFVAGTASDLIKGTSNMIKGKTASSTLPTETAVKQEPNHTQNQMINEDDNIQKLKSALNDASRSSIVVPDSAGSSIQSVSKAGWCFIGEEKGTRNCSKVGVNDKCMSGQIYDTNEQCIKK
jgi:hypothetical protein